MALPFLKSSAKKRDQIVAIDLGARNTKAVYLQRRGAGYTLCSYLVKDAPIYEKGLSVEVLTEHLKEISAALGAKTKQVSIALGLNDSQVRPAEMPMVGLPDMRTMLKLNSKNFLQQDFPGYVWDICILPPKAVGADKKPPTKFKVLAGGAKQTLVNDLLAAVRGAGLTPDMIVPGLIGPANAFELAMPDIFSKEVVALVDMGFKNSSISILSEGEFAMSRVVGIGGDKITSGLAETIGCPIAEAEGLKLGMTGEPTVQAGLEPLLIPLGRELRASLDFFEHQSEKTVGQVFLSGAAAQSEYFSQCLQSELMVPCKKWNPVGSLPMTMPAQQMAEIEQLAPGLAVAFGVAACGMN
jgi:type IV pilus assembly protein PilM